MPVSWDGMKNSYSLQQLFIVYNVQICIIISNQKSYICYAKTKDSQINSNLTITIQNSANAI